MRRDAKKVKFTMGNPSVIARAIGKNSPRPRKSGLGYITCLYFFFTRVSIRIQSSECVTLLHEDKVVVTLWLKTDVLSVSDINKIEILVKNEYSMNIFHHMKIKKKRKKQRILLAY